MSKIQLKVKKTQKENSNEVDLNVEAPREISEKAYSIALRNISNEVDIAGFRKGKAPKEMIEKTVGKGYISQKAFESVFYEMLIDVASQEKLDVIDVVQVSSFELIPEKPLTFNVVVELKPEVTLGKYKGLKIKAKKILYDKKIFVKKTLEKIANNLITFTPVTNRGAKEGDQVVIDFQGKFSDGGEVPGGKAENFQAMLEKDKFLPEFVDKLQGVKIGEVKEITVTFPDNYAQGFSGKTAVFTVKISGIEEKQIPEVNDELAKKVGMENLVALEKKIESQMIEIQDKNSSADFEQKIVDEIIKASKYNISPRMIDKEIDYLLNDVKTQCKNQGINWDDFKSDKKNKEILDRAKEAAIKRISIDLVLNTLIKEEKITASQDEIDNEVKRQIVQYGEQYKHLESDIRFRSTVELSILRNKAVDFLLANNQATWEEETIKVPD